MMSLVSQIFTRKHNYETFFYISGGELRDNFILALIKRRIFGECLIMFFMFRVDGEARRRKRSKIYGAAGEIKTLRSLSSIKRIYSH